MQAQTAATTVKDAPWMAAGLAADERAGMLVKRMTLDEKLQMVHGAEWEHNVWVNSPSAKPALTEMVSGAAGYVPGVKRLGIPAIQMVDAPLGVTRGSRSGRYSTVLPSALSGASGWDAATSYEYGALVGREVFDAGFNMALDGGVNLNREPRNGRNFEYKGEDPVLAGTLVGAEIRGLQAQGVIGVMKHYVVNDQETHRSGVDVTMDTRSLRETDALAFEIGIKAAKPGAIMCSYNKFRGLWACESPFLLNEVLKKDIGFEGFVLSDWTATHSAAAAANAGLDMEMPSPKHFAGLKKAVEDGVVPMSRLDDMVRRILRSEFAAGLFDERRKAEVPDVEAGLEFAQRVAERGTVLLKNEREMLPLKWSKIKSVVVIGGHADVGVLAGGGSALVDPPGGSAVPAPTPRSVVYDRSSPLKALQAAMPDVAVRYVSGEDRAAAASAAKSADVAIVFAVQPAREDTDLVSLSLPDDQDALIAAVAAANPKTVVVLETGGAVTMPWIAKVPAIVEAWYPGIRGGEAIASVLTGKTNPSGKLPITFAKTEQDLPRPKLTALDDKQAAVDYSEGLKVGYKWFEAEGKTPLFAFGHGLSYSRFVYSGLKVDAKSLSVSFDLRNTSSVAGAEIAEVYASLPASAMEPPKRLVAWQRVELAPGESKHVELKVDPFVLSVFDVAANKWTGVAGTYEFRVGGASDATVLSAKVDLAAR